MEQVSNLNLIVTPSNRIEQLASSTSATILEINVDTPNRIKLLQNGFNLHLHENILGRGSFGTVIKAIYKDQQVAVKILNSSNSSILTTIENEANILGWQHKNIISILKIDYTPTYSAIIMERFSSQSLQLILDQKLISLPHRIRITLDIMNGLNFCHQNNLLHLDIKPQNILIAQTNHTKQLFLVNTKQTIYVNYICKLCDFGASMKLNQQRQLNQSQIQGTVRYMSPEALKNQTLTCKSDIYSFGILMWQLLTNQYPYSNIDCNDTVAYKVVKENLRPDSKNYHKSPKIHQNAHSPYEIPSSTSHNYDNIENFLSTTQSFLPLSLTPSPLPKICRSLFINSTVTNTNSSINNNLNNLNKSRSPFKLKQQNTIIKSNEKLSKNSLNHNQIAYKIKEKNFTSNSNTYFDLNAIFIETAIINSNNLVSYDQFEIDYVKIYQLCWNSVPNNRPSGMAIIQLLQNIFMQL